MDMFEKVEKLVEKAGVSYEDAKNALERANGDLLDAMIILEKEGKAEAPDQSSYSTEYEQQAQYVSVEQQVENDRKSYDKEERRRERKEKFSEGVKKFTRTLTSNYLFIEKKGETVAKFPLWLVILILLGAWHISLLAVIISLFFGVTYSFKGENDMSVANNVMDKASDAAEKVKDAYNNL